MSARDSGPQPISSGVFAGLATLDEIFWVDERPGPDRKVVASATELVAGGPAANAAVTFAALGGHAHLFTRLGRHPLSALVSADLQAHGVTLTDLGEHLSVPPPIACVLLDAKTAGRSVVLGASPQDAGAQGRAVRAGAARAGGPQEAAEPAGAEQAGSEQAGSEQAGSEQAGSEQARSEQAGSEQAGSDDAAAALRGQLGQGTQLALSLAVSKARVALFDGHHPEVARLIAGLLPDGTDVVLDCGSWREAFTGLIPRAGVAACSADFRLPGSPSSNGADEELTRGLLQLGARAAAVTHGPGPVTWREKGGTGSVAVPPVTAADTLGAGDAFHGALAWARAAVPGSRLPDQLGFAARVASLRCQIRGPRAWLADPRLRELREEWLA